MGTFNPSMQKATLSAIDSDVHGLISKRTAELDGVSVTEVTFAPGARWSNDLKSYAGTELCELPHVRSCSTGDSPSGWPTDRARSSRQACARCRRPHAPSTTWHTWRLSTVNQGFGRAASCLGGDVSAASVPLAGTTPRLPIGIDGESVLLDLPVACATWPGALRVLLPGG